MILKLGEIYQKAIEIGMNNDPRGQDEVFKRLEKKKKEFEELSDEKKMEFDQEGLKNPYADSRLLHGDADQEIQTILTGVDIDVGEILLTDRLREKGLSDVLVLAHHPTSVGLSGLYEVMDLQNDMLASVGVPVTVAEALMGERMSEVQRGVLPINHNRALDAARLLDIPLMCCHTPADNCAQKFVEAEIEKANPETVADVIKLLKMIPEYQESMKRKTGPEIIAGAEKNRAGKVIVEFTGGTSGSNKIYEKLSQAGVGTIVTMHMREDHLKEAKKHHINVIIASHILSDSLGMNILLDEFEKMGIKIKTFSGLFRVSRV
ncbi:MAG: NGG1p interacting factor NIF3 [Candidatus Hodarchaeota archaeon]